MKNGLLIAVASLAFAGAVQAQPMDRGTAPPSGNFWRTCSNISLYGYGDDATMSGQCQDERGRSQSTTLRYGRCRQVENLNGALTCVDGGAGGYGDNGRPPYGDGARPPYGDGARPPYGDNGRQGWGGGGRGALTLYGTPDFGGMAYEARREITNLPKQFNDRAMSLRITGRGAWQVCTDSDFRGRCQVIDRDVRDLRQYGLGEAISSMRPVR